MIAKLRPAKNKPEGNVSLKISGSKSESNRLLVLRSLFPKIFINNLSDSDDTRVMLEALENQSGVIDIHHAGTAMRFLTAYFSAKPGVTVTLTGSERMKQRPISLLVNALQELGASIQYHGEKGFPPLSIKGSALNGGRISMKAGTSSQYITALLLIAPSLRDGLTIELEGNVTSRPYIEMTLSLLKQMGVAIEQEGNTVSVSPLKQEGQTSFTVESDWSSASYFYSLVALNPGLTLTLESYKADSLQGDSELSEIYRHFGVETSHDSANSRITLNSTSVQQPRLLELDLQDTPDIAQTLVVTCLGLQIPCKLTGLHTLRIKETDRLNALKTEIEKLGTNVVVTNDTLQMNNPVPPRGEVKISTYNDHRMAMAFAPLGTMIPILIEDPEVVSKSFPSYWEFLKICGLSVNFER